MKMLFVDCPHEPFTRPPGGFGGGSRLETLYPRLFADVKQDWFHCAPFRQLKNQGSSVSINLASLTSSSLTPPTSWVLKSTVTLR